MKLFDKKNYYSDHKSEKKVKKSPRKKEETVKVILCIGESALIMSAKVKPATWISILFELRLLIL